MIRRAPTLIALSDLDVQDVKDHVQKQRAAAALKELEAQQQQLNNQAQPERKEMSKEERLGLL